MQRMCEGSDRDRPSAPLTIRRRGAALRRSALTLGTLALAIAPAGAVSADLGADLLDDMDHPKLMDVSRFDGSMPDGADDQFGLELSQGQALDVAPELENGTDLGFVQDKRKSTGLGKAGLTVGDVDEDETDVRGGFYRGTKKGFLIFGWQMGEPEKIKRKGDEVTISQSRDVAVFVNVTSLAGTIISETDVALVEDCSVKATFEVKSGDNADENLPDRSSWRVECDKGWTDAFEVLTEDGAKVIKKIMGGNSFKVDGTGKWADLDQVLDDFDIPFL